MSDEYMPIPKFKKGQTVKLNKEYLSGVRTLHNRAKHEAKRFRVARPKLHPALEAREWLYSVYHLTTGGKRFYETFPECFLELDEKAEALRNRIIKEMVIQRPEVPNA